MSVELTRDQHEKQALAQAKKVYHERRKFVGGFGQKGTSPFSLASFVQGAMWMYDKLKEGK